MSKRLLMLEKMVEGGSKDPFHWYALALEYAGLNQQDDALATFSKLRAIDPGYVPMYLMCGTMLLKAGRGEEGQAWLSDGINAARALLYGAARLRYAGLPFRIEAAQAKLFATDVAMKVTTDAVQVLGGAGYVTDHPVERWFREAKLLQIVEGTNQIQRLVISRALAKG